MKSSILMDLLCDGQQFLFPAKFLIFIYLENDINNKIVNKNASGIDHESLALSMTHNLQLYRQVFHAQRVKSDVSPIML